MPKYQQYFYLNYVGVTYLLKNRTSFVNYLQSIMMIITTQLQRFDEIWRQLEVFLWYPDPHSNLFKIGIKWKTGNPLWSVQGIEEVNQHFVLLTPDGNKESIRWVNLPVVSILKVFVMYKHSYELKEITEHVKNWRK